jgi:hypothetical protein
VRAGAVNWHSGIPVERQALPRIRPEVFLVSWSKIYLNHPMFRDVCVAGRRQPARNQHQENSMLISKFRRRVGRASGVVCMVGAFGLGVVSPAAAQEELTLTIFQNGPYTASLCGLDIAGDEGRCVYDVPSGGKAVFTMRPPAGGPIEARVVPRGGFVDQRIVPDRLNVCFVTGGTAAEPTVEEVKCELVYR